MGRMSETMNTAVRSDVPADRAASIIPNKGDRTMRTMKPIVIIIALIAGAGAVVAMLNSCDLFTEKIPMKLAIEDITLEYTWEEVGKLTETDGARYGCSIDLSGDRLIVGNENNAGDTYIGSAFIYQRDGSSWTLMDQIVPSDPADRNTGDAFGHSVSIDGDYAVVGAYGDDEGYSNSGAGYVFHWDGSHWVQQQKLKAYESGLPTNGYRTGTSVSIKDSQIIVGAPNKASTGGAAFVFSRNGSTWTQYTSALATSGTFSDDLFGYSVSISEKYALIGAYQDDDLGSDSGSAFIFAYSESQWGDGGSPSKPTSQLSASNGALGHTFGYSVSLYDDTAIVGANNFSSAYIYRRTEAGWNQLIIKPEDIETLDQFGIAVDLKKRGAIIGAYYDDDKGVNSGSAYIYTQKLDTWAIEKKITGSDSVVNDNFGYSVAIDENYAAVGTIAHNSFKGAVYIFERKQVK